MCFKKLVFRLYSKKSNENIKKNNKSHNKFFWL